MDFDGASNKGLDYLGDNFDNLDETNTVCCWFAFDGTPLTANQLVAIWTNEPDGDNNLYFNIDNTYVLSYGAKYTDNWYGANWSSGYTNDGTWHFVAGSYDGTDHKLYSADWGGTVTQRVATTNASKTLNRDAGTGGAGIGNITNASYNDRGFPGRIANVMVFDTVALTAAELNYIMYTGMPHPRHADHLIMWVPCYGNTATNSWEQDRVKSRTEQQWDWYNSPAASQDNPPNMTVTMYQDVFRSRLAAGKVSDKQPPQTFGIGQMRQLYAGRHG